jgi:hypothetical protein
VYRIRILVILFLVLFAGSAAVGYASASPSSDFYEKNGGVFDDWEVCRTSAVGENGFYQLTQSGFRPIIAFESLGEGADLAYALGEGIAQNYQDEFQRAEAIFSFVRDRVQYTTDEDQFDHEEFAQNADEMAVTIEGGGTTYGDCEDSAVLLAVMYRAAGYRSAIAVGEGHTAALVYLPGYSKASSVFELDGEPGWIWAEATGKNNPLGWAPKEFVNVRLGAYEITDEVLRPAEPQKAPSTAVAENGGGGSSGTPFPFFGIIFFLWFISSLFRKRRA